MTRLTDTIVITTHDARELVSRLVLLVVDVYYTRKGM
jgi:hypothetical protein